MSSIVYAATKTPLPSYLEYTDKLGTIEVLNNQPAASKNLVTELKKYLDRSDKYPIAIMLEKHGIIVGESDIFRAYDLLERLEFNAYIHTSKGKINNEI